MKHILAFILSSAYLLVVAQRRETNLALHLDGKDNNVRIGMGIINVPWTLEAWIKGDDTSWKDTEVIFGGGEYSDLNITENLPLIIKNGKLHNRKADLWSKNILDAQWHHVALSCDGKCTRLYLDGRLSDSKKASFSIIPGTLGVQDNDSSTFAGCMDEVRIWHSAVSESSLQKWMSQPITPKHPNFKKLVGYYNFDDGMEDVGINWVGKGDQAYHMRNGRLNYKASAPLAYTIVNDNAKFANGVRLPELFNAVVIDNEWDVDAGTLGEQILKLRIAVSRTAKPLSLNKLELDLSKVSRLSDISRIHIYYTGKKARSDIRQELFGNGRKPESIMLFSNQKYTLCLTSGINYILVTADISKMAVAGNAIKISVPHFKLNKRNYVPEARQDEITQKITRSSKSDTNIVKVLQWNIWHGGVHLGNDGISRVIDLIKSSHADIITMQEAYGSQQRIADSLRYFMQTTSPNDNLALYSRYSITAVPISYNTFNSNPAKITLPNGKRLLVNGCWLRYASNPEYTSQYPDTGLHPRQWISEDSVLALSDMKKIIDKDTKPHLVEENMPVIIGGDFNSCSHLDWTKAAAPLHFGYGSVLFPTSRYLLNEGYKDSFREINPNEVQRPEGTWAVIYGHLQTARIDFLYYKGSSIKAISSKIIKTAPEIDDVWASDHAAVLTTFELK